MKDCCISQYLEIPYRDDPSPNIITGYYFRIPGINGARFR